jgi:hypothetical protein
VNTPFRWLQSSTRLQGGFATQAHFSLGKCCPDHPLTGSPCHRPLRPGPKQKKLGSMSKRGARATLEIRGPVGCCLWHVPGVWGRSPRTCVTDAGARPDNAARPMDSHSRYKGSCPQNLIARLSSTVSKDMSDRSKFTTVDLRPIMTHTEPDQMGGTDLPRP